MTDTWYDVLGVEPTASESEIKSAWRSLVTVLGPTDHRFATINEAASVLLDADKRATYDATVLSTATAPDDVTAADEPDETAVVSQEPGSESVPTDVEELAEPAVVVDEAPTAPASLVADEPAQRGSSWIDRIAAPRVTAVAAVLAVALVVATALVYLLRDDGSKVSERTISVSLTDAKLKPIKQQVSTRESADVTAAIQAAIAAAPKALSYDYRTLAKNEAEAKAVMTAQYAATSFTPYFDGLVKKTAPGLKQSVVCGPVLDVGVVRTAPNEVEVLILLDRFASNASASGVSQDFADITMVNQNGTWLISNFGTAPIAK